MRVCVVVDDLDSAIGISALARQKFENSQVIPANQFKSIFSLLRHLRSASPDMIFFAWRGALVEIMSSRAMNHFFTRTFGNVTIGFLVADLLSLSPNRLEKEQSLINCCDFYAVTSKELLNLYSDTFESRKVGVLYRDFPKLDEFYEESLVGEQNKTFDVIWVGNSKWGSHQGVSDHKGFLSLVKPIESTLGNQILFKIIDSSLERERHEVVLDMIKRSKILIQTSASEGTGLPLLEAAGLGTSVLSTNVGVAPELLTGNLSRYLVPDSVEAWVRAILDLLPASREVGIALSKNFKNYIAEISNDRLPLVFPRSDKQFEQLISPKGYFVHLKWFRRWLIFQR